MGAALRTSAWATTSSTTALFPTPLPYPQGRQTFQAQGLQSPHLSASRRCHRQQLWQQARRSATNLLVLLLNFVYLGRHAHPDVEALKRHPNTVQLALFRRVEVLLSAWGRDPSKVALECGRRGAALVSQCTQIEALVADLRLRLDPYTQVPLPGGVRVPAPAEPYCDLSSERIPLRGPLAHWDIAAYLPPHLWLPCQEPLVLRRASVDLSTWAWPRRRGGATPEERAIFRRFASAGLLRLR